MGMHVLLAFAIAVTACLADELRTHGNDRQCSPHLLSVPKGKSHETGHESSHHHWDSSTWRTFRACKSSWWTSDRCLIPWIIPSIVLRFHFLSWHMYTFWWYFVPHHETFLGPNELVKIGKIVTKASEELGVQLRPVFISKTDWWIDWLFHLVDIRRWSFSWYGATGDYIIIYYFI